MTSDALDIDLESAPGKIMRSLEKDTTEEHQLFQQHSREVYYRTLICRASDSGSANWSQISSKRPAADLFYPSGSARVTVKGCDLSRVGRIVNAGH